MPRMKYRGEKKDVTNGIDSTKTVGRLKGLAHEQQDPQNRGIMGRSVFKDFG